VLTFWKDPFYTNHYSLGERYVTVSREAREGALFWAREEVQVRPPDVVSETIHHVDPATYCYALKRAIVWPALDHRRAMSQMYEPRGSWEISG
jgi:hypothetical protein